MLKERTSLIRGFMFIVELLVISANFFVIYFVMANLRSFYSLDLIPGTVVPKPVSFDLYMRTFWLALLIWTVLLRTRGEYQHLRIQTYHKVINNYLVTGILFFGLFTSAAFLFKINYLSRGFIIFYTISTTFLLLLGRVVILTGVYYFHKKGYNYQNILLVGTGRRAQEFLNLIAKHKEWGFRIIGLLDHDREFKGKTIGGHTVLGTPDDLPRLLEEHVVDEVVFVVPRAWLKEIEKCILYCEAVGIPATLSTDFFNLEIAYGVPKEMDGFTYLTFETSRMRDSELLVKRLVDVLFSFIALVLLSPVLIAISIAVRITSKGPALFKQVRSGRNGRKFVLYKFRSMGTDAESRLHELQSQNEMSGPVFKLTNDPRLTSIGKFLRKTSLDELPQFWNVFKGDMSLVGPRPPLPSEVEKYEPWQRRRLSMKPGITCIWQVSGRNNIDFHNWMKLDLQYIDRWSLWLDIKIVLLTVKAVLSHSGAR